IVGQLVTLLLVHFVFDFELPILRALAVVGAAVLFNIANALVRPARITDLDAALYLGFDVLQLSALLYLTGGLQNPFAILILAPVTVAATILSRRSVLGLSMLAVCMISILAVAHEELPWSGQPPVFPFPYVLGVWA